MLGSWILLEKHFTDFYEKYPLIYIQAEENTRKGAEILNLKSLINTGIVKFHFSASYSSKSEKIRQTIKIDKTDPLNNAILTVFIYCLYSVLYTVYIH